MGLGEMLSRIFTDGRGYQSTTYYPDANPRLQPEEASSTKKRETRQEGDWIDQLTNSENYYSAVSLDTDRLCDFGDTEIYRGGYIAGQRVLINLPMILQVDETGRGTLLETMQMAQELASGKQRFRSLDDLYRRGKRFSDFFEGMMSRYRSKIPSQHCKLIDWVFSGLVFYSAHYGGEDDPSSGVSSSSILKKLKKKKK